MIIGIDASTITPNKAGIGYYTYSLLEQLHKQKGIEVYAYTNNIENLPSELNSGVVKFVEISSERPNFNWIRKVSRDFKKFENGVFISPSNFAFGVFIKNSLNVVHDLAPVKFKKFFSKKGVVLYNLQLLLLKRLNRLIVAPSNAVKSDLVEFGFRAENIHVILEGIHEWAKEPISPSKMDEVKSRYDLPDKYILSISTLEPRKNHLNLIRAFNEFSSENDGYKLVLGGKKGWFYEEIFNLVKELKISDKVIFVGYVPEGDLAAMIDMASVFVNVSFYEGFALPLIEAGIRGVKLVASDIPVYREIVQDKALYSDPNDVHCIAKKIDESISSGIIVESNFFDQYSWQKASAQFIDIVKLLPENKNSV